jgi:GntR family transcriptional regulator, vanillate catabolism transcriptional regulator
MYTKCGSPKFASKGLCVSESFSTRSESVVEALRAAILAGHFQPGERLHEVKLTALLEVSRTPVRAALQKLASEGLLDYTPNRGYTLRQFPISEVINAYEVRAVLEGLAARLSAEHGLSDDARTTLTQALHDGDALLQHGHLLDEHRAEYGRINAAIHETIHAAAGSRLLSDMVYLSQQVPVSSPRNVVAFEERDVRRRHDDHHRIYEAITSRDPWRAEMLMRDHVGSVKTSLVRSLQSTQPAISADPAQPVAHDADRGSSRKSAKDGGQRRSLLPR